MNPNRGMDKKRLLADPRGAIIERWGALDKCPNVAATMVLIDELESLRGAIKTSTQEKQICSRQFGEAKSTGSDLEPLRQRMQAISQAISEQAQQRKDLENRLWALMQDNESSCEELPGRFISPPPSLPPEGDMAKVEEIADAQAGEWDAYVDSHPNASLYHRYRWRAVIDQAFGHETLYLVARSASGKLCGLLPVVRLKSRLFGDFGVSLPFFNYGGVIADHPAIASRLLEQAAREAEQRGLTHLEIRSTRKINDWPTRTDKVSMVRRLPDSTEQLDMELGAKVRAQIKRAKQEQAEAAIGGRELLDDFYRVFSINMRDLGTPVYGKHFFRTILETWPDKAHIVVLRLNGRPVATAFLLGDRDLMEIPWASTLRSVNPMNMNMLLYWHVLQFSIERGYRYFDFGRSTRDAGTYRFKKQWGAQPVQHVWHYWLPQGAALPELKPDSPKFRFLVKCWQKLPVALTRLLGPAIVRSLP